MWNELKAEIFIGLLRVKIPKSQRLVMLEKNGCSSYYFKGIPKIVLHVGDGGNQNGGEMLVERKLFNKVFRQSASHLQPQRSPIPLGIFIGL
jgi:hypothetical protein